MKKSILNLGAQELTKKEQKNVYGERAKAYLCKDLACPAEAPCQETANGPVCVHTVY